MSLYVSSDQSMALVGHSHRGRIRPSAIKDVSYFVLKIRAVIGVEAGSTFEFMRYPRSRTGWSGLDYNEKTSSFAEWRLPLYIP